MRQHQRGVQEAPGRRLAGSVRRWPPSMCAALSDVLALKKGAAAGMVACNDATA